ncbi:hypothetical protein G9A89_005577 [Geosiphon pyriformis]|nr:hypothetical protein G9A89_005577 [Geosiphon pyriformis]
MFKNNSPELIKLNWSPNSDIILDSMDPEQFYKHYQELALTKEEQEQYYSVTGWSNKLTNSKGEQYCMVIEINKEGITIRERIE